MEKLIENLTIKFKDKIILENVNIDHYPIIHLVGPNGCGKSSLCKAINDDIQYLGNININKNEVSYISNTCAIPREITINDIDKLRSLDKTNTFYQYFVKNKMLKQKVGTFSTGQLRMLEVLLAISNDHKLIIFDEITANLDYINKEYIYDIFNTLISMGISIINITHDSEEIFLIKGNVYCYENKSFLLKNFKDEKELKDYCKENYV